MSLILEALRKSEAERRRGQVPDVAAELPPARMAHARRTPAWLWPALAVGALALVAALWWSLRDAAPPAPPATPPQPAATQAETASPALVARPHSVAPAIVPVPAQSQAQPVPAPIPPPVAAVATPRPEPPQPSAAPAPPPTIAPPPLATPEDIPTTTASRTELTMHVWDESAARRFVILNGQRMGEGDRNGGLQVLSIERDGVVIERDGQRSRLRLP